MEKLAKRNDTEIRVSVTEYKGKAYVDIREWHCTEDNPEFKPTKKGVTIPLNLWDEFASIVSNVDIKKVDKGEEIE